MKPTAVVVDDEPQFRKLITTLLQQRFPEITVLGEAGDVSSGAELVEREKPDILFLDIELHEMTGFDLLRRLSTARPLVVFVTAYEGYAVKAIKFNALDFLVKPFDKEEFDDAVSKALRRLAEQEQLSSIPALLGSVDSDRQIALPDGQGLIMAHLDDVLYCSSDDNYTKVFCSTEKKAILVTRPLSLFDEFLRDKGFVRIHQSHLVNQKHIKRYLRGEGGMVEISNDAALPVSRRMKPALMQVLEII